MKVSLEESDVRSAVAEYLRGQGFEIPETTEWLTFCLDDAGVLEANASGLTMRKASVAAVIEAEVAPTKKLNPRYDPGASPATKRYNEVTEPDRFTDLEGTSSPIDTLPNRVETDRQMKNLVFESEQLTKQGPDFKSAREAYPTTKIAQTVEELGGDDWRKEI